MRKFLVISAALLIPFIYALNTESQTPQSVPGLQSIAFLITSNSIVTALGYVPANGGGSSTLGYQTNAITTNSITGTTNVILDIASRATGFITNAITTNTLAGVTNVVNDIAAHSVTNVYEFALGDESTANTTGTKVTWRAPFAMTIKDVRASLTTASSSGLPTFNILEGGITIFSTKLTIDANELTSTTAATPYVLSDTALADDASITFTIDVAGTTSAGAKVKLYYTRP